MTRPTPGKIVCGVRNYAAHPRTRQRVPSQPMLFFKPTSGHHRERGERSSYPAHLQVDYEAEIGAGHRSEGKSGVVRR